MSFRAYDGNNAPKPPIELDRDSQQARGLHWWVPLYQGHGYDLAGRRMPNEKNERAYNPRSEINALGAINKNANDNQNRIGNYDLGTVAAPFSMACLCVADSTVDWAGCFSSRNLAQNTTGGDNLTLGVDDAGKVIFSDYNNVAWEDAGPALRTGELILLGVTVRSATDFTLWQVSKSGGVERVDVTSRTIGTTGNPIFHIGEDDVAAARVWDGPIFDCRLATRAWEELDYRHMFAAQTRFDLVLQTRRNFFVPEAPVGGATATSAQLLPPVAQAGTGVMQPKATAAQDLPSLAQLANVSEIMSGVGAQAMPSLTQLANVLEILSGVGSQDLPPLVQAAIGVLAFEATGTLLLPSLEQVASAIETFEATAIQLLPALLQLGSGLHTTAGASGTALQLTPSLVQAGVGGMQPEAAAAQAMPSLTQLANALEVLSGIGSQDLPPLVQAAIGVLAFEATGTLILPSLEQVASAIETFEATAVQLLPSLLQLGSGTHVSAGTTGTAAQKLPSIGQIASVLIISFIRNFINLLTPNPDIDLLQSADVDVGGSSNVEV